MSSTETNKTLTQQLQANAIEVEIDRWSTQKTDEIKIKMALKVFTEWLDQQKVTTGADDSPRMYDSWINELIRKASL